MVKMQLTAAGQVWKVNMDLISKKKNILKYVIV